MSFKLVIFDFDGTLADSAGWFIAALADLAPRHRFRVVTDAEIAMLRGYGNREIIRYLGISKWRLPFIAADLRRRSAAHAGRIKLFEGIEGLLRDLHRNGVTCAVVSSNSEANIRKVLSSSAEAISFFDCGSGLFGKAKRFRRLMRHAGVSREQTLCIGDEQRDIEAARAAGTAAGAALWGYATRELLIGCNPTVIFERPTDIAAYLGLQNAAVDGLR